MGYGYAGTFLVTFLTHPGVVVPSISSVTSLIPPGTLPPDIADAIPTEGVPPFLSGLWQVFCAWALGAPGNGSEGLKWTMFILYIIFLVVYLYFFAAIRLSKGI